MKLPNGISLLVKDRRGTLYLAVYQAARSKDWNWRVSFKRYQYKEPRYFFRMERAADWARNIQWNDYLHLFWLIRIRISHQLRDEGAG
jgi:hypothetical protein